MLRITRHVTHTSDSRNLFHFGKSSGVLFLVYYYETRDKKNTFCLELAGISVCNFGKAFVEVRFLDQM